MFQSKGDEDSTTGLPGLALSTVFNSTKQVQQGSRFFKSQSFQTPILWTKCHFPVISPTVILTPISQTAWFFKSILVYLWRLEKSGFHNTYRYIAPHPYSPKWEASSSQYAFSIVFPCLSRNLNVFPTKGQQYFSLLGQYISVCFCELTFRPRCFVHRAWNNPM